MKQFIVLSALFFTLCKAQDVAAQFLWARSASALGRHEYTRAVGRDATGHVFVAGQYNDTTTIDGVTLPTWNNPGLSPASFLLKYDAAGNLLWSKGIRAREGNVAQACEIHAMAVSDNGEATVFGIFSDSITIGTQTIRTTFNGFGEHSMFGARFDAGGNLLWLKLFSARKVQPVRAVSLSDGSILLSGYFTQQLDLGSSHSLTVGGSVERVAFVTRMNAAGDIQWAIRTNGKKEDRLTGMVVSPDRVYISGIFRDSIRFDGGTAFGVSSPESNANNRRNMFVAAFDISNGQFVWAQQISGQLDWASDVELQADRLVVIGISTGYLKIGSDSTSAGTFVAGLRLTDGQQEWVKRSSKFINRLKATGPDTFYVFGNAGSGAWQIDTLNTGYLSSGFYWAKFDQDGHALEADAFGESGVTMGVSDIFYQGGEFLVGGSLYGFGTINLGGSISMTPVEVSYNDLWFGLYSLTGGGGSTAVPETLLQTIRVYPNPVSDRFTLELPAGMRCGYRLSNMQGQSLLTGETSATITIPAEDLPDGVYLLRLQHNGQTATRKLLVRH